MYIAHGVLGDQVDRAEHAVRVDACLVAHASFLHRGCCTPQYTLEEPTGFLCAWSGCLEVSIAMHKQSLSTEVHIDSLCRWVFS